MLQIKYQTNNFYKLMSKCHRSMTLCHIIMTFCLTYLDFDHTAKSPGPTPTV